MTRSTDGPNCRLPFQIACGLAGVMFVAIGCHRWPLDKVPYTNVPLGPPPPVEVDVANPARIGNVDPEFLWRQIVDTVDDYFKIDVEQPVRKNNVQWLEGRLITYPEVSGTSLEPWRRETARGFQRLQSTFQTIRRTVTVHVLPEEQGYLIEIEVLKEQEDVDQSQLSTSGSAAQRHDGTVIRNEDQTRQLPVTLGWFEVGRDRELERRLMANILGRITNVEPPKKAILSHSNR